MLPTNLLFPEAHWETLHVEKSEADDTPGESGSIFSDPHSFRKGSSSPVPSEWPLKRKSMATQGADLIGQTTASQPARIKSLRIPDCSTLGALTRIVVSFFANNHLTSM